MSRRISAHTLRPDGEITVVPIQRRSRILCVSMGPKGKPELYVETAMDDVSRSIDVKHSREFVALGDGDTAPEGATYIGACASHGTTWLVYEIPGVKPQGL